MGAVYNRNLDKPQLHELWWLDYYITHELAARFDVGRRVREPAGVRSQKLAEAVLRQREAQVRKGTWEPYKRDEVTFGYCVTQRLAECDELGLSTASNIRQRLTQYALPLLGSRIVTTIRRGEIEDLIAALVSEGRLAPRTIHHVYEDIRAVFQWGCDRDPPLLDVNPASLKTKRRQNDKHALPKKKDADPRWRRNAKFEVWEVETILGAPLSIVPIDRLVFYCVMLLSGSRVGEVCGLRVMDYDRRARPLPRLHVVDQGDDEAGKTEELKGGGNPREVPMHPLLWDLLEYWMTHGFPAIVGRDPRPDDYLIPSRNNAKRRSVSHMYNKLQKDLERMGLQRRGNHDARRGFISMCTRFKMDQRVVKAITHEGVATDSAEVFRNYTIHDWDAVCEEMLKVRLSPRHPPPGGSGHSPYAFMGEAGRALEALPPLPAALAPSTRALPPGSSVQRTEPGHGLSHMNPGALSNSPDFLQIAGGVDGARTLRHPYTFSEKTRDFPDGGQQVLGTRRHSNALPEPAVTAIVPKPRLAQDLREAADAIRSGRHHELTVEWRERLSGACMEAAEAFDDVPQQDAERNDGVA